MKEREQENQADLESIKEEREELAFQRRIFEEEKQKLLKVFQFLPEAKMKVAKRLIERVAFKKVTLETLEGTINTKGPTYLFENGSQKMEVEHPAQKSYNTMINRFTAANEKLLNMLPKDDEVPYVANSLSEEVDDFENF